MRFKDHADWLPIQDGDVLAFDGQSPSVLALRAFGGAAVYLVGADGAPDLLLGVADSREFTVTHTQDGPHSLRVVLEASGLPASYKARVSGHTQPDLAGSEPFVVIKPKMVASEEMRTMMRMLHQQEMRHQAQLTEIMNANPAQLVREPVAGLVRQPDAAAQDDAAAGAEVPGSGGTAAAATGDGADAGA